MLMGYTFKQKIGAVIFDVPRFLWSLRQAWFSRAGKTSWVFMRNRSERLVTDEAKKGAKCNWQWTSDLYITKVFPPLGRFFMKRALSDYPIILKGKPEKPSNNIDVSFIIGHRGIERLPNLILVLKSIAAQVNISLECIVIEQSMKEEAKDLLPNWVQYIHTPLPKPDLFYCRSWALNVGASQAKGKLLILHDNDLLVPQVYALELMKQFNKGYEVINLKRFLFYVSQEHTKALIRDEKLNISMPPDRILQNSEGGGSVAVSRDAYFAIGGFDESFVGWGGEDNEFWDRAQTRKVYPYGYLPLVHLWHASQPDKQYSHGRGRYTGEIFKKLMSISAEKRIKTLANREFGNPDYIRIN
ncbi:MAG: hypothetical protein D4S01_04465 [Dehalococcoidia bacterium]|nr:MAG: hypothetical protein D4S01_04465 [Dehalococcoidia bacterium]